LKYHMANGPRAEGHAEQINSKKEKAYQSKTHALPKPIRVLYIQPHNWECGPHYSLRLLIASLNRDRFRPVVILPGPSVVAEEFAQLQAEVHFDQGIRIVPRTFSPLYQLKFWANMLWSVRRLAHFMIRGGIDLVHVNSEACWIGGFAAKIAKVPIVCHLRGLTVLSPPWVGTLTSVILNKFNRTLIAASDQVERAYVSAGVRPELIQVIYNGLDVSVFDPKRAHPVLRSELAIVNGKPLVGMIANLDPRKGHHDFVAACSLVRERFADVKFVIVGNTRLVNSADYHRQLQQLVVKHDLTTALHFLGLRADIPEVLASLDVVVQPSLTEAGPRVPLEAMAMERPLVVTDAGGNSEEVIDGQTGLVVPVGDVRAIADAIIKLLSDRALARHLGKAGRERVLKMFTDVIHTRQVENVYQNLLVNSLAHQDGCIGIG
jgi:glycosyltransferase involved in cell wall biosynthesis